MGRGSVLPATVSVAPTTRSPVSHPAQQPGSFEPHAVSGGRWGAVRSVAVQVISFGITATLTRLLDADEFGLVAIAFVVVTMFDLLTRVGFGASVVRRVELDRRITSTFFWAAVGFGLVAGGLAAALATPTATLAGSVEAAPLVAVAALTLPLNLASRVPGGLVVRDLRFRANAAIDIGTIAVHGVVAITLALSGAGAWAIVIGQVARSAFSLVAYLVVSRFRPAFVFDLGVVREDLGFNLNLLASDVVAYGNRNLDYWFVGNRLGSSALGAYYVAYVLPNLLRQRLNAIGHEVLFPVASKLQDDLTRLGAAYLRVVRLMSFLVFPVMFGLATVADLAVRIGFGPGWDEAVAPMRLIAIASGVMGVGVVARPIFAAIGRPGIMVVAGLLGLAALVGGLAFSWEGGTLVGVAAAVLGGTIVESGIVLARVRGTLGIGLRAQAQAMAPFAVSTLVMVAAVLGGRTLVGGLSLVIEAIAAVMIGFVAYLGIGLVVFRSQFLTEIAVLRRFVRR